MRWPIDLKSARRLRMLIVSVLLAFCLNGIAHAGHDHRQEEGKATTGQHAAMCEYCVALGGLMDVPAAVPSASLALLSTEQPLLPSSDLFVRFIAIYSQPRAPPAR
jgi:hypothetical protein